MMPTGTSLLLHSPCTAYGVPSSAADSRQSRLLPNDWGVRPGPSLLHGSPGSHAVPAGPPVAALAGRTHFLKSHLLGTPPSLCGSHGIQHPPMGKCLPESCACCLAAPGVQDNPQGKGAVVHVQPSPTHPRSCWLG